MVCTHRELVAAQMHYDWCRGKSLAGWKYGDVRDDAHLVHPLMLPMRALDDTARARNFASVTRSSSASLHSEFTAPFPVDHVQLSWDVMILIDLLAENSHEVWATEYAAKGWRLEHPSLKSYMLLDELDKTLTRESVTSVLKSCIYLGCKFLVSRKS
ncbi:Ryanodine receptor Ryr [Phytophthora cactorum]|nr:Ryanodine receptor Ryr [Phytophthora cactorum]